jgi:hypothetical protein
VLVVCGAIEFDLAPLATTSAPNLISDLPRAVNEVDDAAFSTLYMVHVSLSFAAHVIYYVLFSASSAALN